MYVKHWAQNIGHEVASVLAAFPTQLNWKKIGCRDQFCTILNLRNGFSPFFSLRHWRCFSGFLSSWDKKKEPSQDKWVATWNVSPPWRLCLWGARCHHSTWRTLRFSFLEYQTGCRDVQYICSPEQSSHPPKSSSLYKTGLGLTCISSAILFVTSHCHLGKKQVCSRSV